MNTLRKCPRCGSAHPSDVAACPRVSAPLVDAEFASPYDDDGGDEVTYKRKPGPEPVSVRPLVNGAPSAYAAEEEEWEQSVNRDVMVGRKLADYVVKRRIGAGGMGIVYEGEHPVIGRKVAIKILRPDFAEGGRARDLASEARAAAAIRHRGIIDIFGFGSIPGVGQYLVMEYLDGLPLDEVINQRAPMLQVEAVTILDELLSALEAAHAAGVIHRDLKPGNVFVVRDSAGNEHVKVLDFGLAKRSEAPYGTTPQTRQSMMVGTPEYMAPEQACGQQVGPHTDLYAVGVIAFEMLTRRLPFEGESPMAIAVHHVRTPPPPPSTYVELHPAVEALVMQLLAKDPSERPSSAEAVRRELKGIRKLLLSDATQLSPPPAVGAVSTISQEAVAVTVPPTPRVRTERFGPQQPQQPRRAKPPSGKRTPVPPKAPAPVRPTALAPVDPYADKTTAMDLDALQSLQAQPPRPSRAVLVGAGGALALALIAGAWLVLSPGRSPATPMPQSLQAGAVAAGLRDRPVEPPAAPAPPPAAVQPPAEAPPAVTATPQPSPAGEARSAGGQEAVLAATQLARGLDGARSGDEAERTVARKPVRPTSASRDSRGPASRTAPAREEAEGKPVEAAAPSARTGTLTLEVKAYLQEVLVDGKSYGRMNTLELPAGVHTLEVRGNSRYVKPYTRSISITAGRTHVHPVDFEPRESSPLPRD